MNDADVTVLKLKSSLCGALLVNGPSLDTRYEILPADSEGGADGANAVGMVRPALDRGLACTPAPIVHLYLEQTNSETLPAHTFVCVQEDGAQEPFTHFMRPHFSLQGVFPPKTLVHAFAFFEDRADATEQQVILSVFDCSLLGGANLRMLDPTTRFRRLHAALQPRAGIGHHWIGEMDVAREQYKQAGAPFLIHSLLQVPDTL